MRTEKLAAAVVICTGVILFGRLTLGICSIPDMVVASFFGLAMNELTRRRV